MPYDAVANDIVYTFDGNAHETSRKIYQGDVPPVSAQWIIRHGDTLRGFLHPAERGERSRAQER